MPEELLTVQLTLRQARALMGAAQMFSDMVADLNPEWETHMEHDGPPALTTGILALELALATGVAS